MFPFLPMWRKDPGAGSNVLSQVSSHNINILQLCSFPGFPGNSVIFLVSQECRNDTKQINVIFWFVRDTGKILEVCSFMSGRDVRELLEPEAVFLFISYRDAGELVEPVAVA